MTFLQCAASFRQILALLPGRRQQKTPPQAGFLAGTTHDSRFTPYAASDLPSLALLEVRLNVLFADVRFRPPDVL